MNRREMIKMTGAAAVGATVLGLPVGADAQENNGNGTNTGKRRLKVLAIGAHPDDPETARRQPSVSWRVRMPAR